MSNCGKSSRFSRSIFTHNTLTPIFCVEVLQRGCDVEVSPTSERPAVDWSVYVGESVRHGVEVDDIREYQ
jgi:hypothetical protein